MKQDWAYKKAEGYMRGYMNLKTEAELFDHLGAMLRAERRRAVRMCKAQVLCGTEGILRNDYNAACDDCAKAIGRK